MSILRLTSSATQQEIAISARIIEGYWLQSNNEAITLFTVSIPIEIANSVSNNWDNWDEFTKEVRLQFDEQNTFF